MLDSQSDNLDELLTKIREADEIEIFTYIENPGKLLHSLLELLDKNTQPIEKLIAFMKEFIALMGPDAMSSLVKSQSAKITIMHILAEKPKLAALFRCL